VSGASGHVTSVDKTGKPEKNQEYQHKKMFPQKGVSLRVNKKPNGHKKWPAKELEGKCQETEDTFGLNVR